MEQKVINYQFYIRISGAAIIFLLLPFSDNSSHLYWLMSIVVFYLVNSVLVKKKLFFYKYEKAHIYNLFLDITWLSIGIAIRGGQRSDFYIGYFMILSYILIIKHRQILFRICFWIIINYSIVSIIFTDSEILSYGRLFIRLSLLSITTLLLKVYVNMLSEAENKYDKAVKSAMVDPLTKTYNRKILEYFDNIFDSNTKNMFVALIDIDNFKKINDTYGHTKGDEVLIQLSKILNERFNNKGICVRYGGEEFLIIYADESSKKFEQKLKQVKNIFNNVQYHWLEKKEKISFTVGYSRKEGFKDLIEAIEQADKALYKGKNKGKNTVIYYENVN